MVGLLQHVPGWAHHPACQWLQWQPLQGSGPSIHFLGPSDLQFMRHGGVALTRRVIRRLNLSGEIRCRTMTCTGNAVPHTHGMSR